MRICPEVMEKDMYKTSHHLFVQGRCQRRHWFSFSIRNQEQNRRLIRRAAVRRVAAIKATSLELDNLALRDGPNASIPVGSGLGSCHRINEVLEVVAIRQLGLRNKMIELHKSAGNDVRLNATSIIRSYNTSTKCKIKSIKCLGFRKPHAYDKA
jgi:hypothetical protein